MKKAWTAPSIRTLDVRLTENGPTERDREGTMVWINPDGTEEKEDIFHPPAS